MGGHPGKAEVTRSDAILADEVRQLLERLATAGRHHIAAGLQLADGRVITGVNLVSNYGPSSLCAEQAAVAEWAKSAISPILAVIAIRATFNNERPLEVVPPCGRCREILCEYAPEAYILIPDHGGGASPARVPAGDLLPIPFRRRANEGIIKSKD